MTDPLSRRRFLSALAASVIAVGAPLPIGFPEKTIRFDAGDKLWHTTMSMDHWYAFKSFNKLKQTVDLSGVDFKLVLYNA